MSLFESFYHSSVDYPFVILVLGAEQPSRDMCFWIQDTTGGAITNDTSGVKQWYGLSLAQNIIG